MSNLMMPASDGPTPRQQAHLDNRDRIGRWQGGVGSGAVGEAEGVELGGAGVPFRRPDDEELFVKYLSRRNPYEVVFERYPLTDDQLLTLVRRDPNAELDLQEYLMNARRDMFADLMEQRAKRWIDDAHADQLIDQSWDDLDEPSRIDLIDEARIRYHDTVRGDYPALSASLRGKHEVTVIKTMSSPFAESRRYEWDDLHYSVDARRKFLEGLVGARTYQLDKVLSEPWDENTRIEFEADANVTFGSGATLETPDLVVRNLNGRTFVAPPAANARIVTDDLPRAYDVNYEGFRLPTDPHPDAKVVTVYGPGQRR